VAGFLGNDSCISDRDSLNSSDAVISMLAGVLSSETIASIRANEPILLRRAYRLAIPGLRNTKEHAEACGDIPTIDVMLTTRPASTFDWMDVVVFGNSSASHHRPVHFEAVSETTPGACLSAGGPFELYTSLDGGATFDPVEGQSEARRIDVDESRGRSVFVVPSKLPTSSITPGVGSRSGQTRIAANARISQAVLRTASSAYGGFKLDNLPSCTCRSSWYPCSSKFTSCELI